MNLLPWRNIIVSSPILSNYLCDHPFHEYVYIYNGGVYHKPDTLFNKYIQRVQFNDYNKTYTLYLIDDDVYIEFTWVTKLILPHDSDNRSDAIKKSEEYLQSLPGITIKNHVISVKTKKKIYTYKLRARKMYFSYLTYLTAIKL